MTLVEGQGILGRITFVDGQMPTKDRTYLVVSVGSNFIKVLNVSSIKGKERKLAFPTNERLLTYDPPFKLPSFVKLDSLTTVMDSDYGTLKVLHGGQTLDSAELARIKSKL